MRKPAGILVAGYSLATLKSRLLQRKRLPEANVLGNMEQRKVLSGFAIKKTLEPLGAKRQNSLCSPTRASTTLRW